MKVGTKSVLFGAHCWFIHPWFVAYAWARLYGWRGLKDWRLWLCFFLHDLGYWSKPNMDGPEGEEHPRWAANVVFRIVYRERLRHHLRRGYARVLCAAWAEGDAAEYANLCLYHSRFLAKQAGRRFSMLCPPDKLAVALEPWWLYLPRVTLSGEIHEYMALADARTKAGEPKYASMNVYSSDRRQWFANVQEYLRRWVNEHKDGREDTWTPTNASRETTTWAAKH